MPQKQCPWCGKLGPRYTEDRGSIHYDGPRAGPHDDGSVCGCRHVNTANRLSALRHGGRYYCPERGRFVCPSCGTDDPATGAELELLESEA